MQRISFPIDKVSIMILIVTVWGMDYAGPNTLGIDQSSATAAPTVTIATSAFPHARESMTPITKEGIITCFTTGTSKPWD